MKSSSTQRTLTTRSIVPMKVGTIGEGAKVALVEDPMPYADLEIGVMRDLRNPH